MVKSGISDSNHMGTLYLVPYKDAHICCSSLYYIRDMSYDGICLSFRDNGDSLSQDTSADFLPFLVVRTLLFRNQHIHDHIWLQSGTWRKNASRRSHNKTSYPGLSPCPRSWVLGTTSCRVFQT